MVVDRVFVDTYLPALLAQASKIISAEFHEVVRERGLSVTEWRVLSTLYGAGVVNMGQLSRIAISKQPTVTRVVDKMAKLGYVLSEADPRDRRVTLVEITREGKALIEHLISEAKKHEEKVISELHPIDIETLKKTLKRLIDQHRVD